MEEVDAELTAELVELRHEPVALWPEADDSSVEPTSESTSGAAELQARLSYSGTLAYFDDWAASEPRPFNADGEGGLSRRLLGILHNKDGAYLQELEAASAREDDQPETKSRSFTRSRRREPRPSRAGPRGTSSARGADGSGTCIAGTTMPSVC